MASPARWRIGTIGFGYPEWAGVFYPPGLRPSDRLRAYAERFDTVELDTTFYAVPRPSTVVNWRRQVPADFRFFLKAPQALSHGPDPGWIGSAAASSLLADFLAAALPLEDTLGGVLLQFPATFSAAERPGLDALFTRFAKVAPLVVEFRHGSWWRPATSAWLRSRGVVWANADRAPLGEAGRVPPRPVPSNGYAPFGFRDTGASVYLRFCGRHAQYDSDAAEVVDPTERLKWWMAKLEGREFEGREVVAVFGNSYAGHGPATAERWRALLGLGGSVPPPRVEA